jgi:3-phenylpropionate/trans-cinnamate dioxygenase ferredoxin reductase component
MTTFVIVGGGLAGAKAAETLREEGFDGTVVLFGSEPERPYERPPLSKGYLQGNDERESVFVHPEQWYAEHDVDLRVGVTVDAIDPAGHTVAFGGQTHGYDKLLLATGASPRPIDIPGVDLDGVFYLRTLGESERLRSVLGGGRRVVVIGAGWIGLETAAAAQQAGGSVTVVEPQPVALLTALGPELGGMFTDLHSSRGVRFLFGETVQEIHGDAARRVGSVVTSGGTTIPADAVIVGIGAVPNDGLASAAGLEVSNGVLADAALRTSNPDIYAAGDVANSFNPLLRRRVRVEHWGNALTGGPAAARSMLGKDVTYDPVPYFYSDQYDLGMECAGLPSPGSYDQIVYRGDRDGMEFIAFWLSGGRLVAGMNVNVWDVTDDIQALIRSGRELDAGRLANPEIPLPEVPLPEVPLPEVPLPEV